MKFRPAVIKRDQEDEFESAYVRLPMMEPVQKCCGTLESQCG